MAKKILNRDVSKVVDEMILGFVSAYKNHYRKLHGYNAIIYRGHRRGKVALVIGGGTGHEPLFSAFCGPGLGDACACGNICASPNPELISETAKAVDQGKGVLFLYGNYAGDNLNFDMAEEICRANGMQTAHVRVWDDFLSAPAERITDRRGIAGDIFTIKIAGAACDAGLSLEEVLRVTEKTRDRIRSIAIATSAGTLPGNEDPTFEIGDDEMEFGMGLHGEAGIERTKMQPAEDIVARMYAELQKEMNLAPGTEIAVLVNGLGATPLLELNIAYYDLLKHLDADGITVYDAEIKTYCTCMEMGGFSFTILPLDDELKKYYDMPCYCPFYAKGAVTEQAETDEDEDDEPEFDENDTAPAEIKRSAPGVLTELNAQDVRGMILYTADKIIENKPYLTEIDSAIGDGDHGIGMAGGMQKVKKKLAAMGDETDVYLLFRAAGQAMLMSMGGASGVIFGSLYLAGAKDMPAKESLTAADLAQMERKSLAAIQERGGASVGDKTMVDALAPAVFALEEKKDAPLVEAIRAAEAAAKQGMENTKGQIAKFGRAKSLMERAIGHADAGAASVWIIFRSMREYIADEME